MQRVTFAIMVLPILLDGGRQSTTEEKWSISTQTVVGGVITEYSRPGCLVTRYPSGETRLIDFWRSPDGAEASHQVVFTPTRRLPEEHYMYRQAGDFTWQELKMSQGPVNCSCAVGLAELPQRIADFISRRQNCSW